MNATHLSLRYLSSTFRSSSFCHFFRTGLTMSLDATWLLYLVFSVQIGTNRHNEKLSQDLWVFIDIFGHLFVMIAMKYCIKMNSFEIHMKIEYSNFFFSVQSYVGMEIGSFFVTFVDNREDKGCLLSLGVYIVIDWCLFACFGLTLYADKKYVSNTTIKFNSRQKNNTKTNWRLKWYRAL